MDDFIENFQQFKEWLEDQQYGCPDENYKLVITKVINKFKELHLDTAF